jgi:hypothetical protein
MQKYPTQVNLQVHFLELPSHTWAFAVTRGIYAVKAISEDKARKAIAGLFGKHEQSQFSTSALSNTPESQVTGKVLNWAAITYGISYADLEKKWQSSEVVMAARIDFKYSYIRHVPGTPTVFFNGEQTNLNEMSTLNDWVRLIDSLL